MDFVQVFLGVFFDSPHQNFKLNCVFDNPRNIKNQIFISLLCSKNGMNAGMISVAGHYYQSMHESLQSDLNTEYKNMKTLACLFSLLVVSVNAQSQTWYVFDGVTYGKELAKCELSSSTPEKGIKEWEELNWPIELSDEVKDADGKIISLKMVKIVPKSWLNKGGIGTTFWFRTKEACLEGRETAQDLLNEENKNIKIYEESRFAPYE